MMMRTDLYMYRTGDEDSLRWVAAFANPNDANGWLAKRYARYGHVAERVLQVETDDEGNRKVWTRKVEDRTGSLLYAHDEETMSMWKHAQEQEAGR